MKARLIALTVLLCIAGVAAAGQEGIGRKLFDSDSLNAYYHDRPYPVPQEACTPAPEGYAPVYVSTYSRHGSRKLHRDRFSRHARSVMDRYDSLGCLTPLGREVLAKVTAIDDDLVNTVGDLTTVGVEQHRGIAERLWSRYPEIFAAEGTPVRLVSTVVQRAMLSMFVCNARLLELNPTLVTTRQASNGLNYMYRDGIPPKRNEADQPDGSFIETYLDPRPAAARLFTPEAPALRDTIAFLKDLYRTGAIAKGLDITGVDYIWDVFTGDELFVLTQGESLDMYTVNSNSPERGDWNLSSVRPLLRDVIDKADAALSQDGPSADLRFGHDTYLTSLLALMGVNGLVPKVEDPLKVIDVYQDFYVVPMAASVQLVFYRNSAGDVLLKVLRNEVEASLPIETDMFPYYHWPDARAYLLSRCE